jgi:hypothetical protein
MTNCSIEGTREICENLESVTEIPSNRGAKRIVGPQYG